MTNLNAHNGFIFRITHNQNLRWIFSNGIHCANSDTPDPDFRPIGHSEIIERRSRRTIPVSPGGVLSDYVPFYFTPKSIMLYNILTGYNVEKTPPTEIVFLVSSVHLLQQLNRPFLVTDRHALAAYVSFFRDDTDLSHIDWELLRRADFRHDSNDPDKTERYQAEALAYEHVPIDALQGIGCYSDEVKAGIEAELQAHDIDLRVEVVRRWYFE